MLRALRWVIIRTGWKITLPCIEVYLQSLGFIDITVPLHGAVHTMSLKNRPRDSWKNFCSYFIREDNPFPVISWNREINTIQFGIIVLGRWILRSNMYLITGGYCCEGKKARNTSIMTWNFILTIYVCIVSSNSIECTLIPDKTRCLIIRDDLKI